MKKINETLKNLSDTYKKEVTKELKAMGFPTVPEEFVDTIVKTFFTNYGFKHGNCVKQSCAFTTTSGAQIMALHFESNNDKFLDKFGITISDVQRDEISVLFYINY